MGIKWSEKRTIRGSNTPHHTTSHPMPKHSGKTPLLLNRSNDANNVSQQCVSTMCRLCQGISLSVHLLPLTSPVSSVSWPADLRRQTRLTKEHNTDKTTYFMVPNNIHTCIIDSHTTICNKHAITSKRKGNKNAPPGWNQGRPRGTV